MNNIQIAPGRGLILTREFLAAAVRLFGKRGETTETPLENRVETKWADEYKQILTANFNEIFSLRLTNYVLSGSSVTVDNEELDELLGKAFWRARKWCPMAFGIGRVFLVPYLVGDRVYLDMIPQSSEVSLDMMGDDIYGFLAVTDVKAVGRQRYARMTHYHFDNAAHTFEITNKAVSQENGREIPLESVPGWETIAPYTMISGVDRPLFAVVDSPRDNRSNDKLQGAPITYGCDKTIGEILETMRQYELEYNHKISVLGINQTHVDSRNPGVLPREYIKTVGGNMENAGDLFSVYSPDIRSQAYRDRLLELFGLLEKQVGTSKGILTPLDSAGATATEIKRAMFDTRAMVNAMRVNISNAFDDLAYAYSIMLDLVGRRVVNEYTVSWDWSDEMARDEAEEFRQMMELRAAGIVSDVEMRMHQYPHESPEEARRAIEEIRADKPDPYGEMLAIEGFGASARVEDEGGGGE